MYRILRVRLYPNAVQAVLLDRELETCRELYNAALHHRELAWKATGKTPTYREQSLQLPAIRRAIPSFAQASSIVLQTTLQRLDVAYRRFFTGVAGKPRFRRRAKFVSLTYSAHKSGNYTWNWRELTIAKIGAIKGRAGPAPRWLDGHARPKACTLKRMAGKWTAFVRFEIPDSTTSGNSRPDVGIDVGLTHFLATSDGAFYDNPRAFSRMQRRLTKLQRRYTRKPWGSKNKEKARQRVAQLYERARNQRLDHHHKTSKKIAERYRRVAVEDSLAGLYRGMLAKQVYDVGWGQFLRLLEYKLADRGGQLVRVSKLRTTLLCSRCRKKVPKTLKERIHHCGACGLTVDRDTNAARNLLSRLPSPVPAVGGESTPAEIGVSDARPEVTL